MQNHTDSDQPDPDQLRLDPVAEAQRRGEMPALDPDIEDRRTLQAWKAASAAQRRAWHKAIAVADHLPDPWQRFRLHVAGTLRLLIRARCTQELAVADLARLGELCKADRDRLFNDLSALQEQYGGAIDEVMGTALESGDDMLSALQRAQLIHKWLAHVEQQVKQLRHARNLAVREALAAGVAKSVVANHLDVTRTAIRNIINGP